MQFDIKYAYFNFLQAVHYRSIHNPKLLETAAGESDLNTD